MTDKITIYRPAVVKGLIYKNNFENNESLIFDDVSILNVLKNFYQNFLFVVFKIFLEEALYFSNFITSK